MPPGSYRPSGRPRVRFPISSWWPIQIWIYSIENEVSRNLTTRGLVIACCAGLLAISALHGPRRAAAQLCDDDAGDEDAGDEDGGLSCEPVDSGAPPTGEPDASWPDGGGFDAGDVASDACSCDTVASTSAGTIHVCTGARERYECRYLECTTTIKRAQPCPSSRVELCCEMTSRGLYSQLYEDCDHPNCEAGFRAQCHDFGGAVHEGPCAVDERPASEDDSSGGCSAAGARAAGWSAALLWLAGLALALRSARRVKPTRR